MSSNNQSGKSQEQIKAEVLADSIATMADANKSMPQPKGQEAIPIKESLEDKKADANLGSGAKEQEVHFVKDSNVTLDLNKDVVSPKATLYFKGCKDSTFNISARVTKIMIEGCQRCSFTFKGRIFTNTIEIWKTLDLKLNIFNDQVKTLQIDMTSRMTIVFDAIEYHESIVWSGVNDLKISYTNQPDAAYATGFEQMKAQYPEQTLSFTVDQFTTRLIQGKILTEQIVRLANGYPTTEREAKEFDNNAELNKKRAEEFVRNKLKENGVTLGTVGKDKKEAGRNDNCPCGSGKKNKKCCNK
eukprot:gene5354-6680_t